MTQTPLLAGRGTVVVGGSRGVGRAVAGLLAAHGAGVVVNGRDPDAAARAASAIRSDSHRAVSHPGSAANEAVARALVDASMAEYGRIDLLINCAGIAEPSGSSIPNITTADFTELMDAHVGCPAVALTGDTSRICTGAACSTMQRCKDPWTWRRHPTSRRHTFSWPLTSPVM